MTDDLKKKLLAMFDEEDDALKTVKDGDWRDDGKWSHRVVVVEHDGKFYKISQSRSGSYYTDYYYNDPEIIEVQRKEETKIVVTWVPVKEAT